MASACNLDFLTKAIANAQKGQRMALNLDKEEANENIEPNIIIVKGLDIDKI